jgi:hypothetical protein
MDLSNWRFHVCATAAAQEARYDGAGQFVWHILVLHLPRRTSASVYSFWVCALNEINQIAPLPRAF